LEDTVFAASLEIETFTFLKKRAEKKLAALQAQITELSSIFWPPTQVKQRLRYLLDNAKSLQTSIESYDKGILENRAIVSKAWIGRHTE
jgi:sulfur transfer protein SufE